MPSRSLATPTLEDPSMAPNPPNIKRIPRMAPRFSLCKSETAAVAVGKTMEKNSPVNGMKIDKAGGPKVPIAIKTMDANEAKSILFKYPM